MTTAKRMVLEDVHCLPEEASFHDIAEEVAFLAAVREGQEDLSRGRVISNEELKQRLDSRFPNNMSDKELVTEQIALLATIKKGEEAAESGQVTSHEAVKDQFAQWLLK